MEIKPILQSVCTCIYVLFLIVFLQLYKFVTDVTASNRSAVVLHKPAGSKAHKNLHMVLDLDWNYLLHVFVDYFDYSEQTASLHTHL